MRIGAWMLDTSTRIAPMQILLDRGLSQAGVLDRGLSHATWASYWSHGAFWTRQRLMTRDFASLHPCRQAAYFLPCARPPDACGSCLDRPRQRRPEGSRDRSFQAFAVTRAGTDTMLTTSLPATFFEGMLLREGTSSLYSGYFTPLSL